MRGRAKEAEEKKRLEKERKEVPEEVKDKFEKWNRYEKLYVSHNGICTFRYNKMDLYFI